jgi:hypothetical protein
MKKKLSYLSILLVLSINLFYLFPTEVEAAPQLLKGLKSTQNGVIVCSCPVDENFNCLCNIPNPNSSY